MAKTGRSKSRRDNTVIELNLRDAAEDRVSIPPNRSGSAEAESVEPEGEQGPGEENALASIEQERNEYYDLLLRKQAEFENYRKRILREREESRNAIRAEVIAELLPVVDACEKGLEAIQAAEVPEACRAFTEGYELLLRQLQSFLEKHEVSPVPGVGSRFDPNVHEAVQREMTREHDDNEVIDEYRRGYLIGERLLRPSQVKVAVWPDESE